MGLILSNKVDDCKLIQLPKIHNRAGNITPVHNFLDIPFEIKRVYYLYDVPGGEERGGHAHKQLFQLIVAASGSFNILISDGDTEKNIHLNRPYFGLCIVPGIWRTLVNFSSGAICLVLASAMYDASEYIRDYQEFLTTKKNA